MDVNYHKKWGIFHNPAVAQAIARLDPKTDTQEIVRLMVKYEFSWDILKALEMALLYTYGSQPVSTLLDRTGEFQNNGQKRYDDTAILISTFLESGWDSPFGRTAIERINKSHGHYIINNDEFLFVLWTFVHFPIDWSDRFGRRAMTQIEREAWTNFWLEIGKRMGMTRLPKDKAEFDVFAEKYEQEYFVYCDANHHVTKATLDVIAGWMPKIIHPLIPKVVMSLYPERFLQAVGYNKPFIGYRWLARLGLGVISIVQRFIVFGHYPSLVANRKDRTYHHQYQLDQVGPTRILKAEKNQK